MRSFPFGDVHGDYSKYIQQVHTFVCMNVRTSSWSNMYLYIGAIYNSTYIFMFILIELVISLLRI